ncbi:hypothetical protein SLE2022_016730 [Rubroshorea leprosula]
MQVSPQKSTTMEAVRIPARRPPLAGVTVERIPGRRSCYVACPNSSPGLRPKCTCSNHPGSARCSRHGYMVPSQKSRNGSPNKEILRRALTPPNRRMTLRWWNFRPTPSRLSNMSMA